MRVGVTEEGLVRVGDSGEFEIVDLPFADLSALFSSGVDWRRDFEQASVVGRVDPDRVAGACPVGPSSAIWGVGLNYNSKVQATGRTPPAQPVVFLRSSSTGARPGGVVEIPPQRGAVDYEGELAAVIARPTHHVPVADAWAHVALVVPANDMTEREVMRATGNPTLAKSLPGFGPLGWMGATPDEFSDPDDLPLRTEVNGVVRQADRTAGMLLSVPEVISFISSYVVLQPGDVVLTGSPAGNGDEMGEYLVGGDVVDVYLADLPVLRTTVVAQGSGDPR